jgi:hypothetical protein
MRRIGMTSRPQVYHTVFHHCTLFLLCVLACSLWCVAFSALVGTLRTVKFSCMALRGRRFNGDGSEPTGRTPHYAFPSEVTVRSCQYLVLPIRSNLVVCAQFTIVFSFVWIRIGSFVASAIPACRRSSVVMSSHRKKTAVEYDAEVDARVFGRTPSKRTSSAPQRADHADDDTPRRSKSSTKKTATNGSSKKKKTGTPRTPGTPRGSSKKKNVVVRAPRSPPSEVEVESQSPSSSTKKRTPLKRSTLLPRLQALIPIDARAVDVNQLARLSGLSGPSPSPVSETEAEEEDQEGPRGYLTQKGLQTLKEYK